MNTQRRFLYSAVAGVLAASMWACQAVSLPLATPTPVPGLGMPVTDGQWEVTLSNPREESRLTSSSGNTYTPNEGYTFLLVDAEFRNLDPSQETKIDGDTLVLTDSAGVTFTNIGSGFGTFYNLGSKVTYSNDQSDTMTFTLVFTVNKDNIAQEYKFQFLDLPPITFKVQAQ